MAEELDATAEELPDIEPGTIVTAADWWNPLTHAVNRNSAGVKTAQSGLQSNSRNIRSVADRVGTTEQQLGEVGTSDDGSDSGGNAGAQLDYLRTAMGQGGGSGLDPGMAHTVSFRHENSGVLTVSRTSFGVPSGFQVLKFNAPPSGMVKLIISADIRKNTSSWYALSYRVGTSESGSQVIGPSVDRCVQQQSDRYQTLTGFFVVDGLEPGGTYYATLLDRVGSGNASVNRPFLMVEPLLV